MAVDPNTVSAAVWTQYIPHVSLVGLALTLVKWGRSWVRKWGQRMKAVEDGIKAVEDKKATILEVNDRVTIAELNAYQSTVARQFAELASQLEQHADKVEDRFQRQEQVGTARHDENVRRFDNFSRDTTERLDRIFAEIGRGNRIGRGGFRD